MLVPPIELRAPVLQLLELAAPWGVAVAGCDRPGMYVVHRGTLDLAPARLGAGDLLLLPSGGPHVLAHAAGAPTASLADFERRLERAPGGIVGRLRGPGPIALLSAVPFSGSLALPWLPRRIHVRAAELDGLERSLVAAYGQALEHGEAEVLARIVEALWQKIVTARLPHVGAFDPDVLRVIAAVLERPRERWDVAGLARLAGLSRSRFVARFTTALGASPIHWVRAVRMRHAETLLRDHGMSVARVADELGFGDESAFRKAFRRALGHPARARRAGGCGEATTRRGPGSGAG